MKISVDSSACEGYGQCSVVDFELFPLDDDGYSAVGVNREVPAGEERLAQLAVATCPVAALKVING